MFCLTYVIHTPSAPHRKKRSCTAFSLLELLIVITIIGIIALIVLPRILVSKQWAKENACYQNVSEINTAVERYNLFNEGLPADINALDVPASFPSGIPNCPVTGNAYTLKLFPARCR